MLIKWRFIQQQGTRRLRLPIIQWHTREGYGREVSLSLLFEPRDAWIGLYWDNTEFGRLILYVCFIPMFPLRVAITTAYGGRFF